MDPSNCHIWADIECPSTPSSMTSTSHLLFEFHCRTSKCYLIYDEVNNFELGLYAGKEEITSSTIRLKSSALREDMEHSINLELARHDIAPSVILEVEDEDSSLVNCSSFLISLVLEQPEKHVVVNIKKVFYCYVHEPLSDFVRALVPESLKEMECEKDDTEFEVKTCTICLEEILIDSIAMPLQCNHVFHCECIIKWLKRSSYCPNCRFEMPTIFL